MTVFLAAVLGWIGYIVVLSSRGVLNDFGLPPRVPLLIVIPAITAIVFVTGKSSFKNILVNTRLHLPVYLQSFRIFVELLIYGAFLEGVFPEQATMNGLNFDILVGISAPVIGLLIQYNKIRVKALIVWNIIALVILAVTVYSFISTYYFTDYLSRIGSNKSFVDFPYLLLPSVLLPVAIFLHVISIRQAVAHSTFAK